MLRTVQGQASTASDHLTTMSYSYGPTVVYAPSSFAMSDFGSSYDHKENYGAGLLGVLSKASTASTRQAFGSLNNGCYADATHGSLLGSKNSSYGLKEQQVTSTSGRIALSEKKATTHSANRQPDASNRSHSKKAWVDIDEHNKDNPLACSEYAEAIFQHLHTSELLNRPNANYINTLQLDMSSHMRCILVDWLVEVAQEYRLTSDTLHLTLNLLDRFLSVEPIAREELQLAGVACMWAASKFEEIYAPTAANFCYITDNTYSPAQLVEMEAKVLATLSFQLAVPTAKTFQRRYLQAAAADEKLHYLSAFLLELSLMDEQMLKYVPSQVAAASVYLANNILGRQPAWDATLSHYSRYKERELLPCACDLACIHAQLMVESNFTAIKEKYASQKLLKVSQAPVCQALVQQAQQNSSRGFKLAVVPDSPARSEVSSDMDMA